LSELGTAAWRAVSAAEIRFARISGSDPNIEREMLWCSIYGTFLLLNPFAFEGSPPDISALLGE
jgi:hypothetical protein